MDCTARVCMPQTIDLVALENICRATAPSVALIPSPIDLRAPAATPPVAGEAVPEERGFCKDTALAEGVVLAVMLFMGELKTEPNAA